MSNGRILTREIIVILLIKSLLISAIWYFFFSHPIDKQLTSHSIFHHFNQLQQERAL